MNRLLVVMFSVAFLCMGGCGPNAEAEKDAGGGLDISLPRVEIKVNEEDGISVKAPGTDVRVNEEGIEVQAPGTNVEVNEDGVKVKAPETDVKVHEEGIDIQTPGTDLKVNKDKADTRAPE